MTEKVDLAHGPIPAGLFAAGLRWFKDDPDTERFFAVRWDGRAYRPVVPPQMGTATRLKYRPARRGGRRVPLPRTLPRLLLEDRRPRRAGVPTSTASPDASTADRPELSLRVGVYGHFAPVEWSQVFSGPAPGLRLMAEEADATNPIEGGD